MSMVDTHSETLARLVQFIVDNAPPGAERDIAHLQAGYSHYGLEFRRGNASCNLYIEIHGDWDSFFDEAGNRWRKKTLTAHPSWPSWGSMNVAAAQERLALMTEVTRFATDVEREFAGEWFQLAETAEQIVERKRRAAEDRCRGVVADLIRANMKGMRVGQERLVEAADLLPVGEVKVCDGDRHYTARVTANRAFFFTRTA